MIRHRACSNGGAPRNERGVAIVEFAMVALFMFTLAAATFDFGFAWRSGLAVNEAARAGARVGSGVGKGPGADFELLTGVKGSLQGAGMVDDVELVVIFRSQTANGKVPASCTAPPYGGPCNVLTGDQLDDLDRANFDYDSTTTPPTGSGCMTSGFTNWSWCSTSRNNSQASADYIGIYVRYAHDYMFPIMGEEKKIERTAVMRLEPPVQ